MHNYYKNIRNELLNTIKNSPIAPYVSISEEAGLHFLIKVNTHKTDKVLIKKIEQAGIHISCLSEYCLEPLDQPIEHILIMNYSGIKQNDIKKFTSLFNLIKQ